MSTPANPDRQHSTDERPAQIAELVRAYIGRNWERHYKAAWERIGGPDGLRNGTSWNWAAAIWMFPWLAHRRHATLALRLLLLLFVAALLAWMYYVDGDQRAFMVRSTDTVFLLLVVALFLGFGVLGDREVLARAYQRADAALARHGSVGAALDEVRRAGGVKLLPAAPFAPIPFVIVLSVAVVLFAPPGLTGRQKGYKVQTLSDLLSLRTAEEIFFTDSGRYTTTIADLAFSSLSDVNAPVVTLAGTGWRATATNKRYADIICGVAVGAPNPIDASATDGTPVCRPVTGRER